MPSIRSDLRFTEEGPVSLADYRRSALLLSVLFAARVFSKATYFRVGTPRNVKVSLSNADDISEQRRELCKQSALFSLVIFRDSRGLPPPRRNPKRDATVTGPWRENCSAKGIKLQISWSKL